MDSQELKERFAESFNKLTKSNEFKDLMKTYHLHEYKLEILNEKHRNEVIDIMNRQFSYKGGQYLAMIFELQCQGPDSREQYMIACVDHAIQTGLSIVSLDNNNKVATIMINFDATNDVKLPANFKQNIRLQKRAEVRYHLNSKDPWKMLLKQQINKGCVTSGEVIFPHMGCIRHDLVSKGLFPLLSVWIVIALAMDNYKWAYGSQVHGATVHFMLNDPVMNGHIKGGYARVTHKLYLKKWLENKFENDEWYQANLNKKTIFSEIVKSENDCLMCTAFQLKDMRKHYGTDLNGMLQFWKDYIHFYKQQAKL